MSSNFELRQRYSKCAMCQLIEKSIDQPRVQSHEMIMFMFDCDIIHEGKTSVLVGVSPLARRASRSGDFRGYSFYRYFLTADANSIFL
jgi:hypothetical protein